MGVAGSARRCAPGRTSEYHTTPYHAPGLSRVATNLLTPSSMLSPQKIINIAFNFQRQLIFFCST